MSHLSLDDFEWVEYEFDRWELVHKEYAFAIAAAIYFAGWQVHVLFDVCNMTPLHVDTLDAAQAVAQITAAQHTEKYDEQFNAKHYSRRVKDTGPPPFQRGVFKMD